MKLAIPVETKDLESKVCLSFGRAPYFLIYDTETKEHVVIDNTAATSMGGAGIKASQAILDQGAEVLLAPRLGKNAADVLKSANVKIYKTTTALVRTSTPLARKQAAR